MDNDDIIDNSIKIVATRVQVWYIDGAGEPEIADVRRLVSNTSIQTDIPRYQVNSLVAMLADEVWDVISVHERCIVPHVIASKKKGVSDG